MLSKCRRLQFAHSYIQKSSQDLDLKPSRHEYTAFQEASKLDTVYALTHTR